VTKPGITGPGNAEATVKAAVARSGLIHAPVSTRRLRPDGFLRGADAGADQAECELPAEVRGLTGKAFLYLKRAHV
jgi:hypothetical protein